jgi:hypothetical protein
MANALWWDRMAEILEVTWPTVEAEYFLAKGLTNIWGDLPVGQNQNEKGPQPGRGPLAEKVLRLLGVLSFCQRRRH